VGVHAFNLGQTEAMRALGEAAGEVDILIHDAGDILAGSLDSIRVVDVDPGPVAIDRMVKLMKRRALKI
jgi:NADP-dependent 3-hydroxy acid dehydrogenase YdfG